MAMTRNTFILIPGAGGSAWYWHLVVPRLEQRGHEAVPVSLPAADDAAGLPEYADAVVRAIGDREPRHVVIVAQSLGGFAAPLVCQQVPVALLVLVNAMIPKPGETPAHGGRIPAMTRRSASRTSATAVRRMLHLIRSSTSFTTCPNPWSTRRGRRASRANPTPCSHHPAPSRVGRRSRHAFSWEEQTGSFRPSSNGVWHTIASAFRLTRCQAGI